MITSEEKIFAIAAHIGYLFFGIAFIIVPLAIFFYKKNSYFVCYHAKQALVAQSILLLISIITMVLCFVLVGIVLLPFLFFYYIVFFIASIFAAYKALTGEYFKYPFIQSIVRYL